MPSNHHLSLFNFYLCAYNREVSSFNTVVVMVEPFTPLNVVPQVANCTTTTRAVVVKTRNLYLHRVSNVYVFTSYHRTYGLANSLVVQVTRNGNVFHELPCTHYINTIVVPVVDERYKVRAIVSSYAFNSLHRQSTSGNRKIHGLDGDTSSRDGERLDIVLHLAPSWNRATRTRHLTMESSKGTIVPNLYADACDGNTLDNYFHV